MWPSLLTSKVNLRRLTFATFATVGGDPVVDSKFQQLRAEDSVQPRRDSAAADSEDLVQPEVAAGAPNSDSDL